MANGCRDSRPNDAAPGRLKNSDKSMGAGVPAGGVTVPAKCELVGPGGAVVVVEPEGGAVVVVDVVGSDGLPQPASANRQPSVAACRKELIYRRLASNVQVCKKL